MKRQQWQYGRKGETMVEVLSLIHIFAENAGVVQELVLRMPVLRSSATDAFVGGIAAKNTGTVRACTVGPAPHTSDISDFAGLMSTSSKLSVVTGGTVGGIVGENVGIVTGCLNTAQITADTDATAGGLVGSNDGMEALVTLSYNTGAVAVSYTHLVSLNPCSASEGMLLEKCFAENRLNQRKLLRAAVGG